MALRFRQSFQLFPGVHINVGKTGISTSIGAPGATANIGNQGIHTTLTAPGTGLSYRTRISQVPSSSADSSPEGHMPCPSHSVNTPGTAQIYVPQTNMREISSASVEKLTSESLTELRDLITAARKQRDQVEADLTEAKRELASQENELHRRGRSLFRWFYKKRINELGNTISEAKFEVERLTDWSGHTKINISFETTDAARRAYGALVRSFASLRDCSAKWDVTSDRDTNRLAERTMATRTINRYPAKFEFTSNDLIKFDGKAMQFENINGEDILLYPGVALLPRSDGIFALIDIRELRATANTTKFIEDENVPSDATVVGYTWAKANKDGSPDRRFNENYQIPVCAYGRLFFESEHGVTEEYQVSNAQAATAFSAALAEYQKTLSEGC